MSSRKSELMAENLMPSGKILKKMGYLRDQSGILKRYFREEGNWNSHIDNCHRFILNEINREKPKNILVLGSGWLLDFPIDSEEWKDVNITLVDIFHPRQIQHKIDKMQNVQLLEADITEGLIENVFKWVQESRKAGKNPDILELGVPEITFHKDFDFVISLNILSQLDTLVVDYINNFWKFSDEELEKFRGSIQAEHLKIFHLTPGILISDITELQKDKKGVIVNEKRLIFAEFSDSKNRESWEWNFDTHFVYNDSHLIDLTVEAISF